MITSTKVAGEAQFNPSGKAMVETRAPTLSVFAFNKVNLEPQASVTQCRKCSAAFGVFRWKHNCRKCGSVVCDDCSKREISHPLVTGNLEPQRTCDRCFENMSQSSPPGLSPFSTGITPTGANPPVYGDLPPSYGDVVPQVSQPPRSLSFVLNQLPPVAGNILLATVYAPALTPEMLNNDRIKAAFYFANAYGIPVRWFRCLVIDIFEVRNPPASEPDGTCRAVVTMKLGLSSVQSESTDLNVCVPASGALFSARFTARIDGWSDKGPLQLLLQQKEKGIMGSKRLLAANMIDHQQIPPGSSEVLIPLMPNGSISSSFVPPLIRSALHMSAPALDMFCFVIRHEWASFGDFQVLLDNGAPIFRFTGEWPMQYHMSKMTGQPMLTIRQRSFLAFEPSYDIVAPNGAHIISITRRIAFGGMVFTSEMPNGAPATLQISGDWLARTFHFSRNGYVVATTMREWGWSDRFTLYVEPTEDPTLIVSMVVAIEREIIKSQRR